MPSSKNYKRSYTQEQTTATARGEDKDRAQRNKARRLLTRQGRVKKGDGMDVDHKMMMKNGGITTPSNLRVVKKAVNRSRNGHTKKK